MPPMSHLFFSFIGFIADDDYQTYAWRLMSITLDSERLHYVRAPITMIFFTMPAVSLDVWCRYFAWYFFFHFDYRETIIRTHFILSHHAHSPRLIFLHACHSLSDFSMCSEVDIFTMLISSRWFSHYTTSRISSLRLLYTGLPFRVTPPSACLQMPSSLLRRYRPAYYFEYYSSRSLPAAELSSRLAEYACFDAFLHVTYLYLISLYFYIPRHYRDTVCHCISILFCRDYLFFIVFCPLFTRDIIFSILAFNMPGRYIILCRWHYYTADYCIACYLLSRLFEYLLTTRVRRHCFIISSPDVLPEPGRRLASVAEFQVFARFISFTPSLPPMPTMMVSLRSPTPTCRFSDVTPFD